MNGFPCTALYVVKMFLVEWVVEWFVKVFLVEWCGIAEICDSQ